MRPAMSQLLSEFRVTLRWAPIKVTVRAAGGFPLGHIAKRQDEFR